MKTKLIVALLFLLGGVLFNREAQAQANKVIYTELLGNGFIVFSLNYDQRISKKKNGLGFKLGVSAVDSPLKVSAFSGMANYLIGKERHFLELGVGAILLTEEIHLPGNVFNGIGMTSSLMYRCHSLDGGFMFRGGVAPFLNQGDFLWWWPSVGVGFNF